MPEVRKARSPEVTAAHQNPVNADQDASTLLFFLTHNIPSKTYYKLVEKILENLARPGCESKVVGNLILRYGNAKVVDITPFDGSPPESENPIR